MRVKLANIKDYLRCPKYFELKNIKNLQAPSKTLNGYYNLQKEFLNYIKNNQNINSVSDSFRSLVFKIINEVKPEDIKYLPSYVSVKLTKNIEIEGYSCFIIERDGKLNCFALKNKNPEYLRDIFTAMFYKEIFSISLSKVFIYNAYSSEKEFFEITPSEINNFKTKVFSVIDKIKEGDFKAAPSKECFYCPFENYCLTTKQAISYNEHLKNLKEEMIKIGRLSVFLKKIASGRSALRKTALYLKEYLNENGCCAYEVSLTEMPGAEIFNKTVIPVYFKTRKLYRTEKYLNEAKDVLNIAVKNYLTYQKSITDKLTEIYNRSYFDIVFKDYFKDCVSSAGVLNLFVFDIDYFKKFNDNYGHLIGDEVLKFLSRKADDFFSAIDCLVFRYGGEEFAVLNNSLDFSYFAQKCCEFRKITDESSMDYKNKSYNVKISGGAAFYSKDAAPEEIFKKADALLYKSKKEGRNRVNF